MWPFFLGTGWKKTPTFKNFVEIRISVFGKCNPIGLVLFVQRLQLSSLI